MSNPFIKFGNWEIFIEVNSWEWQKLGTLKKGKFKINQDIEEILGDNWKIIKIKPKSAELSGEIEDINIEIIWKTQTNFNYSNIWEEKKIEFFTDNKRQSPLMMKFVNLDNSKKEFSIQFFNTFIKNSLSLIFQDSHLDPTIKMPLEFIWYPNNNNKIFEISDKQ